MHLYQLLTPEEASSLYEVTSSLDWEIGRARTEALTGTIKQNNEVLTHPELTKVGKRIGTSGAIQVHDLPLKLMPPKFSRYTEGQHYKLHTDAPWMGDTRTDLSCTLWLNDDYEGGELVIEGKKIKGKPGQCLTYPCGEPHEVLPVTSGERVCIITWIQSRVRDPIKRKWLSDMRKFIGTFEDDKEKFLEGSRLFSSMMRRWTE